MEFAERAHFNNMSTAPYEEKAKGRIINHCRIAGIRLNETNGALARDLHVRVVAMEPSYGGTMPDLLPEQLHLGRGADGPFLETITGHGHISVHLGTCISYANGEAEFSGPLIPLFGIGFRGPMLLRLEAWCGDKRSAQKDLEVSLAEFVPGLDPR